MRITSSAPLSTPHRLGTPPTSEYGAALLSAHANPRCPRQKHDGHAKTSIPEPQVRWARQTTGATCYWDSASVACKRRILCTSNSSTFYFPHPFIISLYLLGSGRAPWALTEVLTNHRSHHAPLIQPLTHSVLPPAFIFHRASLTQVILINNSCAKILTVSGPPPPLGQCHPTSMQLPSSNDIEIYTLRSGIFKTGTPLPLPFFSRSLPANDRAPIMAMLDNFFLLNKMGNSAPSPSTMPKSH